MTAWQEAAAFSDAVNGNGKKHVRLEAVRGDATHVRRTRWAWKGWAPLGALLVLAGEPGCGKGVLSCYLLANLTRGAIPGDLEGQPVDVMWVAFEDSWPETILPRMIAAGADIERVHHLQVTTPGEYLDLMRDQEELGRLVQEHDLRAICFEALPDHLAGVDDHRNAEVRRALVPLVELSRTNHLLTIGTTHLNKATSGGFRHRVAGSGGYLAVARVGLLVHRHPDDPDLRVLALGKGNLGEVPDSMVFSIEGTSVVNPADPGEMADVGALSDPYFDGSLTADEVLAGPKPERRSREDDVVEFLEEFLAAGRQKSADVYLAGAKRGLGEKALLRHKAAAGVRAFGPVDGHWWWEIVRDGPS